MRSVRIGGISLLLLSFATVAEGQRLLQRLEQQLQRLNEATGAGDASGSGSELDRWGLTVAQEPSTGNVVVRDVRRNGWADRAGLAAGDQLLAIDRTAILNARGFERQLARAARAGRVVLQVARAGVVLNLTGTTQADPTEPLANEAFPNENPSSSRPEAGPANAQLGIRVSDVTAALRLRYGITVREAAVVTFISPGGPAEALPLGAAIVAIDGRRIARASDLVQQIAQRNPGDTVRVTYLEADRMHQEELVLGPSQAGGPPAQENVLPLPPPDSSTAVPDEPSVDAAPRSRPATPQTELLPPRLPAPEETPAGPDPSPDSEDSSAVGLLQRLLKSAASSPPTRSPDSPRNPADELPDHLPRPGGRPALPSSALQELESRLRPQDPEVPQPLPPSAEEAKAPTTQSDLQRIQQEIAQLKARLRQLEQEVQKLQADRSTPNGETDRNPPPNTP